MNGRRPFEGAPQQATPINWTVVLDHLEGEVLAAEETMARGRADEIAAWGRRADDWIPPSSLGQIPADLRERAARRTIVHGSCQLPRPGRPRTRQDTDRKSVV